MWYALMNEGLRVKQLAVFGEILVLQFALGMGVVSPRQKGLNLHNLAH